MATNPSGFFTYITDTFGNAATKTMKEYAQCQEKLANMLSRKNFLQACRRKGVFPQHITKALKCLHEIIAENGPYVNKVNRIMGRFKQSILNLEIKQTFFKIGTLRHRIQELTPKILQQTNQLVADRFVELQTAAFRKHLQDKSETTSKKLRIVTYGPTDEKKSINYNERAILNSTAMQVPAETLQFLSLGPKFALPHTDLKQVPLFHIMADVEGILQQDQRSDVQDQTRCRIVNVVTNYIRGFDKLGNLKDPVVRFCTSAMKTTARFLKDNPNICLLSADKGNRTVIMDREEYDRKMKALIEDDDTYAKINRDPTSTLQTKSNNIVKRLQDLALIDDNTARKLRRYDLVCPRIYGQPKAHKPDLPLRPVVPTVTAPTYMLCKFAAEILQDSLKSRYTTSSSFEFCEQIVSITLPEGYI